ncbi:hypothetical protein COCNU_14G005940 [Cocos nucifera]|uniref:Glycosyl transferase family 28 C-terminal domain-containing protein n=1 Tax=Cocos nucifera TaxID=13894 RepID=A0A8K0NBS8_COCNU|nr:hypothetical protein COCNU_14G005940 [Cocos nucifera]
MEKSRRSPTGGESRLTEKFRRSPTGGEVRLKEFDWWRSSAEREVCKEFGFWRNPTEGEIPSPFAADDHQTKNAYIMADIAGSKVLTEDELDSSSLQTAIDEILGNEHLMAEMSEKALKFARPSAAADVAKCILSLVLSNVKSIT